MRVWKQIFDRSNGRPMFETVFSLASSYVRLEILLIYVRFHHIGGVFQAHFTAASRSYDSTKNIGWSYTVVDVLSVSYVPTQCNACKWQYSNNVVAGYCLIGEILIFVTRSNCTGRFTVGFLLFNFKIIEM